jgi:hypothetical protein
MKKLPVVPKAIQAKKTTSVPKGYPAAIRQPLSEREVAMRPEDCQTLSRHTPYPVKTTFQCERTARRLIGRAATLCFCVQQSSFTLSSEAAP